MTFYCTRCQQLSAQGACANSQCEFHGASTHMERLTPFSLLSKDLYVHILSYLPDDALARLASVDTLTRSLLKQARRKKDEIQVLGSAVHMGGALHPVRSDFTFHHLVMKWMNAYELPVALLINKKPAYMALGGTAKLVGHSAIVNLVQNAIITAKWKKVQEAFIYANHMPTDADLGILIEQLKFDEFRLVCRDEHNLYVMKPSKECKRDVIAVFRRDTQEHEEVWSEGELKGKEKQVLEVLEKLKKPTDVFGDILPPLHSPFIVVPCVKGLAYEELSPLSAHLFDTLFVLASYALASPALQTQYNGHSVGALMVSNQGDIFSWGIDVDSVRHGEVSTIKLLDKGLQQDERVGVWLRRSRLYTSLEPCFQCSGLLSEVSKQCEHLTVVYGQVDPAVHKKVVDGEKRPTEHTFLKAQFTADEVLVNASHDGQAQLASKLDAKRRWFHQQHLSHKQQNEPLPENPDKRTLMNWEKDAYKFSNSMMAAVKEPAFSRRFAKGLLQLIDTVQRIQQVEDLDERRFLHQLWKNTLEFLTAVEGCKLDALLMRVCQFLDKTRGTNPYKAPSKDERRVESYAKAEYERLWKLWEGAQ